MVQWQFIKNKIRHKNSIGLYCSDYTSMQVQAAVFKITDNEMIRVCQKHTKFTFIS